MAGDTVTGYGDAEPEDAWDAGDPPSILVENLCRRLELVDVAPVPRYGITAVTLDAVADRVLTLRATRTFTGRSVQRMRDLEVDVAYVRRLLEAR